MSEVAQNSYIHQHQQIYRKGVSEVYSSSIMSAKTDAVRKGGLLLDTIAKSSRDEKKELTKIAVKVERAQLQAPKNAPEQDCYTFLAAAFGKMFMQMSAGMQTEVSIFAQEQAHDQEVGEEILISTTNAVNAQNTAEEKAQHIEDEMKGPAFFSEFMNYFMMALMAVVIIGTVVASVVSAGAAAAALPEEVAGEAAMASGDVVLAGADNTANITISVTEDVTENVATSAATDGTTAGTTTATEGVTSTVASTSEAADSEVTQSVLQKIGNKLLVLLGTAIAGSPMLVNGIMGQEQAALQDELATTQEQIGQSLQRVGYSNASFTKWQQRIQQDSGIIQDLSSQLETVVSTFGDMMGTVRGATRACASVA
ncbi:MAG: hypothetical protein ACKVOH_00995 [Chlamydiales bacterium]